MIPENDFTQDIVKRLQDKRTKKPEKVECIIDKMNIMTDVVWIKCPICMKEYKELYKDNMCIDCYNKKPKEIKKEKSLLDQVMDFKKLQSGESE